MSRACNHRTLGRRPTCELDTASSLEAVHRAIGDFAGTAYFVDPNHAKASNQHAGTDPQFPLRTVAEALTKVQYQRGDVILVGSNDAWNYAPYMFSDYATAIVEEVTIPYTASGVRIIGMNQGTMGVTWTPASNGGTCITNYAIDVVIEGFLFTEGLAYNGCDGIYALWDGASYFGENLTVRHCMFDDSVDTAIQMEYTWYCRIHDCIFWEVDEYGIYVDAGGDGIEYGLIHDNIFHDCTVAMAILAGSDNNYIYRNQIYNASAEAGAAATNEGINLTGGAANVVADNFFSCLLPVPANGDYDDLNTTGATDAWINNHCLNGDATTNPT